MLLLLFGSLAHAASEVGGERDFGIGLSFGSQVEGISVKLNDTTVAYQLVIGGYGGFGNFGKVWGARLDWLAETPSFVTTDVLDLAVQPRHGRVRGLRRSGIRRGIEGVLGLERSSSPFRWTSPSSGRRWSC
jgi:hypothetical protein